LTQGGLSSSIVSGGGFHGDERVGTTKRTWPSPEEGRDMSAFIERITGSQVGGATERSIRLSLSIIRLGPAIILLLLVLAMTLLSPVFLTGANISNVVVQTSVLAVLAIGQLFVILLDTTSRWGLSLDCRP
jgi:hypothetical protein